MKKNGGIFLFSAVFSALFAQNFTPEETKISADLAKKFSEAQSSHYSVSSTANARRSRHFICNCENIEISFEEGLKILQNYEDYENRFRYIVKSENTDENNYFFILGIPLARTWLWGGVYENIGKNEAEISFVQTKSEINYSDSVRSMIVIDFETLVLQWNLTKIDENNSRFCLTGAAEPTRAVPQWLIRTALRKVIPRTLRDLR